MDIHNLEGDVNRYMEDGIKESDRMLLVSRFALQKIKAGDQKKIDTESDMHSPT